MSEKLLVYRKQEGFHTAIQIKKLELLESTIFENVMQQLSLDAIARNLRVVSTLSDNDLHVSLRHWLQHWTIEKVIIGIQLAS